MAVAHFCLQSYSDFQTCFFFEKFFFRELQIFIIKNYSPQRAYHLWMWLSPNTMLRLYLRDSMIPSVFLQFQTEFSPQSL